MQRTRAMYSNNVHVQTNEQRQPQKQSSQRYSNTFLSQMSSRNNETCTTSPLPLGCVHIDTSTSTCPGFGLRFVEASLVRVERSQ